MPGPRKRGVGEERGRLVPSNTTAGHRNALCATSESGSVAFTYSAVPVSQPCLAITVMTCGTRHLRRQRRERRKRCCGVRKQAETLNSLPNACNAPTGRTRQSREYRCCWRGLTRPNQSARLADSGSLQLVHRKTRKPLNLARICGVVA